MRTNALMGALASTPVRTCVILLAFAIPVLAQDPVLVDGRPVLMISNDKLTLGVRMEGGAMVRLVLNDDRAGVNPLHAELGHFVCVDGFGPVSPEERTAGLPGHGEAHRVMWEKVSSDRTNGSTTTVSFSATLPIVHARSTGANTPQSDRRSSSPEQQSSRCPRRGR